VSKFVTAHQHS